MRHNNRLQIANDRALKGKSRGTCHRSSRESEGNHLQGELPERCFFFKDRNAEKQKMTFLMTRLKISYIQYFKLM